MKIEETKTRIYKIPIQRIITKMCKNIPHDRRLFVKKTEKDDVDSIFVCATFSGEVYKSNNDE